MMTNYNAMIKVRLWIDDDSVDLTIMKTEYTRLLSWATCNGVEVYTLNDY